MMTFEEDYHKEFLQICQICKKEGHEGDMCEEHYYPPPTYKLCKHIGHVEGGCQFSSFMLNNKIM
jgi:hypothetical protein